MIDIDASKLKELYENKAIEVNGRKYTIDNFNHRQRRKVFAYYMSLLEDLSRNNLSFLDSGNWDVIEKHIFERVLFENVQLSKLEGHWDKYAEDYVFVCLTLLSVISYPFLAGNLTS